MDLVKVGVNLVSQRKVAACDAVRVFGDGYGLSHKRPDAVRVFGIRGEVISAQCVIKAGSTLKDLTVSVSPLQHSAGSTTISKEQPSPEGTIELEADKEGSKISLTREYELLR